MGWDFDGKIVEEWTEGLNAGSNFITIDVSDLKTGFYYLLGSTQRSENFVIREQFIKE